jgi:hypothetical protein
MITGDRFVVALVRRHVKGSNGERNDAAILERSTEILDWRAVLRPILRKAACGHTVGHAATA